MKCPLNKINQSCVSSERAYECLLYFSLNRMAQIACSLLPLLQVFKRRFLSIVLLPAMTFSAVVFPKSNVFEQKHKQ